MCQELMLPDNTYIERLADLKTKIKTIIFEKSYKQPVPDDSCLCCVNLPETAIANGLNWKYDADKDVWKFYQG